MVERGASLSGELTALKRRGCTVLLVGDVATERAGCERLLGDGALSRRHLFLATTTGTADALAQHGRSPTAGSLAVVDATGSTGARAVGARAAVDPRREWYTAVDGPTDVRSLVEATVRHAERLAADDPEPGTLRWCVESADPFFDALDARDRRHLFAALTAAVRRARGLGHVHVSTAVPAASRIALDPFFDATVRVRTDPRTGEQRQRWRLHESGYETAWLPLD